MITRWAITAKAIATAIADSIRKRDKALFSGQDGTLRANFYRPRIENPNGNSGSMQRLAARRGGGCDWQRLAPLFSLLRFDGELSRIKRATHCNLKIGV